MTSTLQGLRNLAFVGHPSAGKTTLVDALAHLLGLTPRKGMVTDRTSICDTEPEEHDKGHTLQMAVVQGDAKGCGWTLIDTPGYDDFIADSNGAIGAADIVIGVHSAAGRPNYDFKKELERAAGLKKGRIIVVTHVDGDNIDFDAVVDQIDEAVGELCVPFDHPNATGAAFKSVASIFEVDHHGWKQNLMDRVMDACEDEELLNRYLETQTLSDAELHAQIPKAIARGSLVPILACNPVNGVGVDRVLAFLAEFCPHPGLFPQVDAEGKELACTPEADFVGQVINIRSDAHLGKICTLRVLSGQVTASDALVGPRSSDKGEKVGGLFRQIGKKKREPLDVAKAGELVAVSKVEGLAFGDAVAVAGKKPRALVPIAQPEPMVSLAAVPRTRADEQKIGEALKKLESEDPTFKFDHNPDTHELVIHGTTELHLAVIEARLKRRYGVEISTHPPRIAYRETVSRQAEGHHRHKKQTGGRGQFGECYVRVRPNPKGAGVTFTDGVIGGTIPRNLIPAVEKGMRDVVGKGILTSSQIVDLDFEVYDGKYHDVDSDEASFKMAGARAFMDAFLKAAPVLLEPVMELEVSVPTDFAGAVFSDLTSHRRGQVVDQWNEHDGQITAIKAHAPLSLLQTYQRDLKSMTAGEGSFVMKLHDYAPLPVQEQARVLAQIGKKHEHEE
ncbi:MAG: elongation factor G [Planctomycetota bacterium]|nr:elongation factor G [Planctomycetota bacterium]